MYLVPGSARAHHPDDLQHECLSLDTLMRTLRQELDEPVRQKHGEARAIVFLVVLDTCRVNGPDRSLDGALSCEPAPESAPLKYTIVFSCRRTTAASDGPSGGHSPFARALLDATRGIFAEGVSLHTAISNMSNVLPQAQALISVGLEALPQDFCICPGLVGEGKRKWEADAELQVLLQDFKLGEQAGHLAKHGGVTSLEELKEFEEKDVEKLRLPLLQAQHFRRMLQHVQQQEEKQKGSGPKRQKNDTSSATAAFRRQLDDLEAQGNVRAIVEGMRACTHDTGLQKQACAALYSLAQKTSASGKNGMKIAAAGGIEGVLAAMDAHLSEVGVQEAGCGILATMTGHHDCNDMYKKVMSLDSFIPVLNAMKQHIGQAGVQKLGFKVLGNVANYDTETVIASAGFIPLMNVVLAAMEAHTGHAEVQLQGYGVLKRLACTHNNQTAIASAGGIAVVLAAMKAHTGHVVVQLQGCGVLTSLACNADNQKAIAAAEVIPVVLAVMKMHKELADVQSQGCGVLRRLASNADNQTAIADAGGIPVVLEAMKAHTRIEKVQEHGCGVLSNLARDNADNQKAIAAEGGIFVVLAVMKEHMRIADVQEQGCGALGNIGWSDTTLQKRIKDEGGVFVVQAAVAASGATAQCREHGQKLLGKLT